MNVTHKAIDRFTKDIAAAVDAWRRDIASAAEAMKHEGRSAVALSRRVVIHIDLIKGIDEALAALNDATSMIIFLRNVSTEYTSSGEANITVASAIESTLAANLPSIGNALKELNRCVPALRTVPASIGTPLHLRCGRDTRLKIEPSTINEMPITRQERSRNQFKMQAIARLVEDVAHLMRGCGYGAESMLPRFIYDPIAKLGAVRGRIKMLCEKFQENMNAVDETLYFTADELRGVDLGAFAVENNMYKVTLKYPDYIRVITAADNEATRRRMYNEFRGRCRAENTPLIVEILNLRLEEAKIFGYACYADYALQNTLLDAPRARQFIKYVGAALLGPARDDVRSLMSKQFLINERAPMREWDLQWAAAKARRELGADAVEFDTARVVVKVMEIYGGLLGLDFEQSAEPAPWRGGLSFDAKDTPAYAAISHWRVYNGSGTVLDAQKIKDLRNSYDDDSYKQQSALGEFYLDLAPRQGKYNHYAEFDLRHARGDEGKPAHKACAALLCNFGPKMKYSEVIIFFHEFGHLMHEMCSTGPFNMLAGNSTRGDMVEMVSQFFEFWCGDIDVLRRLYGFSNEPETNKDIALNKLLISDYSRIFYAERLINAAFDQAVHLITSPIDARGVEQLWRRVDDEYGIVAHESSAIWRFEHIVGGYGAKYYGYLLSLAVAADLYAEFKRRGDGIELRERVLSVGGHLDPLDMFYGYARRLPSMSPFLKKIGGVAPAIDFHF